MFLHYLQNHHFPWLEVSAGAPMLWEVGNGSLKVDNAVKSIPAGQRKGSSCVKSYQGTATKYE